MNMQTASVRLDRRCAVVLKRLSESEFVIPVQRDKNSVEVVLRYFSGLVAPSPSAFTDQLYITSMSRFFRAAGDSDSDTEESEEEELMSSDDEAPQKPAAQSKPTGMARFLKGAASSSSSSESDSDEDSDEDESDDEKVKKKKNAFLVGGEGSDDSDEDVKRVVKSASEKRQDEMEAVGKTIENALRINDWVAISNGEKSLLPVLSWR